MCTSDLSCPLSVLAIFMLLGSRFPYYLGLWTIGMASALVPWRRLERPFLALVVFFGLLIVIRLNTALLRETAFAQPIRDYGVALTFAFLLISLRGVRSVLLQRLARANHFMASFSFSLYLIHFPLLLFLLGALHRIGWFSGIATGYAPTDATGLFVYALVGIVVLILAFLFAQATEARTGTARGWLRNTLPRR